MPILLILVDFSLLDKVWVLDKLQRQIKKETTGYHLLSPFSKVSLGIPYEQILEKQLNIVDLRGCQGINLPGKPLAPKLNLHQWQQSSLGLVHPGKCIIGSRSDFLESASFSLKMSPE